MVNKQLMFIRKHPVTADHRREISIRDPAKAGAFLRNRQPRNPLEIVTHDELRSHQTTLSSLKRHGCWGYIRRGGIRHRYGGTRWEGAARDGAARSSLSPPRNTADNSRRLRSRDLTDASVVPSVVDLKFLRFCGPLA
jgi:hypothetical protein